ncbi:flagellar biosynthesis anti-sigma factor FlgM [Alteromonas sp. S015]|uniref:flagellar biosynthesis anti-sigma factor FlgM n=1 Tax=Alteromonas sp. S015 TaxID=3117401 RepID=UPI002FE2ADFE
MTIDTRITSTATSSAVSALNAKEHSDQKPSQVSEIKQNAKNESNQVSQLSLSAQETLASLKVEDEVDLARVNAIRAQIASGTLNTDTAELANEILNATRS